MTTIHFDVAQEKTAGLRSDVNPFQSRNKARNVNVKLTFIKGVLF